MNELKLNSINILKPEYGLKYTHLTKEEIIYITECNGCYKKSLYKRIQYFITRNKDLKKFEEQIADVSKLNSSEHSPYSYIFYLVLYGRIDVCFDVMRKITSHSYNEVYYSGSEFINTKFIDSFKNRCSSLGYCQDITERNTREIMAISLFFKVTSQQIPYMFNEYIQLSNQNVEKVSLIMPSIYTVLINMGYKIENSNPYWDTYSKRQYVSANMSQEFMKSLNEYKEWYGNKINSKTMNVKRSNLMVFFNYIAQKFPSISKLNYITNYHIVQFKNYQMNTKNIRKKSNSVGTINNRIEAISNLWDYFIREKKYGISANIVTQYDKLNEHHKYAKYIKKRDYNKLIKALKNIEDKKFLQMKIIIIILLSTGRRIHEVLSLKYDCLNLINGKTYIYFHAFKHDKPARNIEINDRCKFLVLMAKEIAKNYVIPLKSKNDNLEERRLFPSISRKGTCVLSDVGLRKLFYEFQIKNEILDEEGNSLFAVHDIKRTFVSNLLSLGYSSDKISKFLRQQIDSIIPYESKNEIAMKTLKLAEEKGLLIGSGFSKESISDTENNKLKSKIINLLKNTDVINRHKENLMYKLKNPKEVMPLALGECIDISSIEGCGPFICLACEEILPEDINIIEAYLLKIYKFIYMNKRKKEIKEIEKQVLNICKNIYINKETLSDIEMKKHINLIKKKARAEILVE